MTDVKFPATLYKYRDWSICNHKMLLIQNQLYFASISSLNDPFDVDISLDFSLLDTDEKIQKFSKENLSNIPNLNLTEEKMEMLIKQRVIEIKTNPDDPSNQFKEYLQKVSNENFGLLSLSMIWDSILMWSHYSKEHTGYCIGFDTNKLMCHHSMSRGGIVNYIKSYPHLSPLEPWQNLIWTKWQTKARKWKYEKEFRIIWAREDMGIMNDSDRKLYFPNDYVKEVILGLNSDDQTKSEITSICKEKGWPLYQIVKVPWKYEIGREKIL